MQLLRKIFNVVFVSLSIISCQTNNEKIKEFIQPINLVVGKVDSVVISYLYFAPDYKIKFEKNSNLVAKQDIPINNRVVKLIMPATGWKMFDIN